MKTKLTITHDCPICGRTISILAGREIPADITYIKTKRHSVVLVHTMCLNQKRRERTNEHIKSKEDNKEGRKAGAR